MSLRAIWRRIWHPTGFVGRDLQGTLLSYILQLSRFDVPAGNSFYERANPLSSAGYMRTKRSVKYRKPDDMWNYIGGSKRLPIQWSAWLAHTRPHPPSVEELQVDLIRQQRVQYNAALIEANFQQERAQSRIQESAPSMIPSIQHQSVSSASIPSAPDATTATPENITPSQKPESSLPKTGSDEYKPESWTPQLRVRRG